MSGSPKSSLNFRLSNQISVSISYLSHVYYKPRPFHYFWFDSTNTIWWRLQIMKLSLYSLLWLLPLGLTKSLL
jgi:hypothetical protein